MDSSQNVIHPPFERLPTEIVALVTSLLRNQDIKNLRLANRFACTTAKLRLSRVFLSANPLDIQVFRSVADHDSFRLGVFEVIWDDARFDEDPNLLDDDDGDPAASWYSSSDDSDVDNNSNRSPDPDPVPRWYKRVCAQNISEMHERDRRHPAAESSSSSSSSAAASRASRAAAAQLCVASSWRRYRELRRQQREVVLSSSSSDVAAFRHGLRRFPSLRRVTVTPAAHGWAFQPLYETPTIRGLPWGFNYPVPRGWPTAHYAATGEMEAEDWERSKHKWRGVCAALRELAAFDDDDGGGGGGDAGDGENSSRRHNVTEFVVDAHHLQTGLNCTMFEEPAPGKTNAEYDAFAALLRKPGFARLELDLLVGGQEYSGWPAFRSGRLRAALAGAAPTLRHLRLGTDKYDFRGFRYDDRAEHPVPELACLVPVGDGGSCAFPRLEHFGLRAYRVRRDDLADLLVRLMSSPSSSLRSVELSAIRFHGAESGDRQDYSTLLAEVRQRMGWSPAETGDQVQDPPPVHERMSVILGEAVNPYEMARMEWGKGEDFLYTGRRYPFVGAVIREGTRDKEAWKAVVRDAFDESYEKLVWRPRKCGTRG